MSSNIQPSPRIAIIGSGAVGCYYGGRLAQHGNDVHFLMRSDYEHVKRHGLKIQSHLGDFVLSQVNCHRTTAEIGPCDLVIIAMKATANETLLELLPPLLKPDTFLLTLQNGLGSDDFLARHFGSERVLGGLCFVCINRIAPGVIHHIAQGQITLGEYSGAPQTRTEALAEEFRRCGVDCVVEASLVMACWKKLVWNIPFNGLSIAAGGKDTAAILADPVLEQRVRDLMREIIVTAGRLGHEIPLGLIDTMIERTRTMSTYKPSSLIDFLAGSEVELEAIWGEPVRRAKAAGIEMPRVAELYQQLKQRIAARTLAA
ncbi:2-dehydropantoate 2-reductase [Prosthecobacter sp.]|uniref:2-dehydropantoate 2-reductase n=1 Tax=Prosthecobacter sp. TaxID=1965333 RepID=UPI002ABC3031|nr:2-dehydropantoate 2-reductase [Prosthecobacter sp.]MDZ4402294.1 2-dehydropantoate 2-reductase [Prosthecobacter sp.]